MMERLPARNPSQIVEMASLEFRFPNSHSCLIDGSSQVSRIHHANDFPAESEDPTTSLLNPKTPQEDFCSNVERKPWVLFLLLVDLQGVRPSTAKANFSHKNGVASGITWEYGLLCPSPFQIFGHTAGEVKTVADMHERKAEMARQADAFIDLPGGYGTMEELLEMITWSQLGIHDKPVGLLNVDGYYNCLLSLFDKGVEEGFIKPSAQHIVVSAPTGNELIARMEEYVPIHDTIAPRGNWETE